MKNKHIELVKKWLADNDSVSHEELRVSADRAAAAVAAPVAVASVAAHDAAHAVAIAAAAAHAAAVAAAAAHDAEYWVQEYEETDCA